MLYHKDVLPWGKAPHWRCSWYGQGTPHGSCWWVVFPYQIQFHHQESGWAGSPAGSHSSLTLYGPHPGLSPPAQLPLCSDPLPSCFQHRSDLEGRSDIQVSYSFLLFMKGISHSETWHISLLYPPNTKLSGLKICPKGPDLTESMVPGSKSTRMARGTYLPPPQEREREKTWRERKREGERNHTNSIMHKRTALLHRI